MSLIYDEGISLIPDWVRLQCPIRTLSRSHAEAVLDPVLPHGWKSLITIPFEYLADVNMTFNLDVTMEKGLLRLRLSEKFQTIEEDTFEILAQHTAVKSALKCLVCGKRGMRRRPLNGWPALCGNHHIQYVNYIAEKEEHLYGNG